MSIVLMLDKFVLSQDIKKIAAAYLHGTSALFIMAFAAVNFLVANAIAGKTPWQALTHIHPVKACMVTQISYLFGLCRHCHSPFQENCVEKVGKSERVLCFGSVYFLLTSLEMLLDPLYSKSEWQCLQCALNLVTPHFQLDCHPLGNAADGKERRAPQQAGILATRKIAVADGLACACPTYDELQSRLSSTLGRKRWSEQWLACLRRAAWS